MTQKYQRTSLVIVLLVALAASRANASRRFNLFDPVFADEDSDTHTVSAGVAQNARATPEFGRRLDSSSRSAPQSVLPPRVEDIPPRRPSAAPSPLPSSTTAQVLIKKIQSARGGTSEPQKKIVNSKRQINATNVPLLSSDALSTVSARKLQTTEQPKHWSALENYYEKLRQSVVAKQLYDKSLDNDEGAVYNRLVQESLSDNQLANSQKYLPIYRGDPGPSGGKQAQPVILSSSIPHASSQPFYFPADTNYRQAPYISNERNSGIGANGLMMVPMLVTQQQLQQQRQDPLRVLQQNSDIDLSVPAIGKQQQQQHQVIIQQQPIQIDAGRPTLQPQQQAQHKGSPAVAWSLQQQPKYVDYTDTFGSGGATSGGGLNPTSYELRKLPELLIIQQAQNRAKHQQETFGSWYDEQKIREQLQEEAHCGPRNQLYSNQAAPVEFPSHMGLYNGSRLADEDFICAAAWVSERFALTLASCVKNNVTNSTNLYARTGEWNTNRNWTSSSAPGQLSNQLLQKATMIVRQVARVHLFPRYQANSSEHNLALLEWIKPIDFLEVPYGSPACQMTPRSSLRANNCWAPVRNTTFVEYFDAEGEGETKLRRVVKMDEANVKLLAVDDAECQKQTAIEFFNFQHPNYICSADIKKAAWRLKLNHADYLGSGIYCNEAGSLNLVSILHPTLLNTSSAFGYMDLSYYRPWMRNVMSSGRTY